MEMTTVDAKVLVILKVVYYLVVSTHFKSISRSPSRDENITSLKPLPNSTWNVKSLNTKVLKHFPE